MKSVAASLARCAGLVALLIAASSFAAGTTLSWDSLSGEQQYILARLRGQWPKLSLEARQKWLERADILRLKGAKPPAAAAVEGKKSPSKPAERYPSTRKKNKLSPTDAAMSAHSFRLRRLLRGMSGISAEERSDLLARWSDLTNAERIELVDNYTHNIDDDDEIDLQRALREGTIKAADLQRGLASGSIKAGDLKAALDSGNLSTQIIQSGIAKHQKDPEDLEKAMQAGNIESSDLNNAIEHNRTPLNPSPPFVPPLR